MKPITLQQRVNKFNQAYPQLIPPLSYCESEKKPFIWGYWFLGSKKQSRFYGSYSVEYLKRINSLFADATSVVHLFAGSMPPGPYTRVGLDPTGQYHADLEINAEQLSSYLPFHPDLIFADPPYTHQEAEQEYQVSLVNGPKV